METPNFNYIVWNPGVCGNMYGFNGQDSDSPVTTPAGAAAAVSQSIVNATAPDITWFWALAAVAVVYAVGNGDSGNEQRRGR